MMADSSERKQVYDSILAAIQHQHVEDSPALLERFKRGVDQLVEQRIEEIKAELAK